MEKTIINAFTKDIDMPPIVQEKADIAFLKIKMEGNDIMRNERTVHVEFENLGTIYEASYENVLDGKWYFDIPLTGKNAAVPYTLNVNLGDTGATVTTVEVSPISVRINYDFSGEIEKGSRIDEDGSIIEKNTLTQPPEFCGVRLKDGTLLPYITDVGLQGYTDDSCKKYVQMRSFDRVVDPEQVDALLFIKSYPKGDSGITEENLYIVPLD